mmetsp:Transcript_69133/g.62057  ORF Transcript_69133/g.62057 Transcript_69133/m.62057 type:complete len:109 (+) Transcript_69133:198-524(+)
MGPPGGFNTQMKGWLIYEDKLWIAFNAQYDKNFIDSKNDIEEANQRWTKWYGSLTEGILNYMCLSYDRQQYTYCENNGQPLAPAANSSEEIYQVMIDEPEWFSKFRGV